MSALTRRGFLRASGLGLGVLAGGGLAGCAASMKGDFMPKAGPPRRRHRRRLGRRHRGEVRAAGRPGHRGRPDRAQPPVRLLPVQQPGAGRAAHASTSLTMGYDGLRKHGVQDHPRDARRAIEPDTKRVRLGEGYLAVRPARGLARAWTSSGSRWRGSPQSQDTVLHAWKAGPQTVAAGAAARGDAGRRRLRADACRRRLSLPARPLRADLPGGLVPQDQQAAVQAHRARRQPEHRLEGRALPRRRGRPTPTSTTGRPAGWSGWTRARARCGPSSTA